MRRVSRCPIRPPDGRARPGPSRAPGRRPHQARVRHRRLQLSRHQTAAAHRPRNCPRQRIRPARWPHGLLATGRRRTTRTQRQRGCPGTRRRLPRLLLPQAARSVRRRRPVCQGASARQRFAVPLRRGHDRRRPRGPGPSRLQRAAWKYTAGTPNVLGVIASAQALRLVLGLVSGERRWFATSLPMPRPAIKSAMNLVARHIRSVTERALEAAQAIPGLTVYGPAAGVPRSPLLAFNVAGMDPMRVANGLNELGVESRAGCHCATLAHRDLGLTPPASCRLSFTLYTSIDDVERAMDALRRVAAGAGGRGGASAAAAMNLPP